MHGLSLSMRNRRPCWNDEWHRNPRLGAPKRLKDKLPLPDGNGFAIGIPLLGWPLDRGGVNWPGGDGEGLERRVMTAMLKGEDRQACTQWGLWRL